MTNSSIPAAGRHDHIDTDHAIIDSLQDAISILAPFSDFDEAFAKHAAYGMLAMFWGRTPWLENIDYASPGVPDYVGDTYGAR